MYPATGFWTYKDFEAVYTMFALNNDKETLKYFSNDWTKLLLFVLRY